MGCPILPTFYWKTLAEFKSLVAPLLPPRPSGASKLTYTAARSVSGPISLIAFIGIILLKGHRQKNGIVMVDFALEGERKRALAPERAIFEACLERFRPIMMGRSPRCSVRFRW